MQRRTFMASALAAALSPTLAQAQAGPRVAVGYTAATDYVPIFVGTEEGFFARHGLVVEPKFIPLNSTMPAAVQSDSLQIAGPTPSVFLQAVDGGLDQVIIAGGSASTKAVPAFALLARAGSNIRTAQDCVGRKIGVPGLGAFLHVTFRAWLQQSGVDYRKVNFIEAAFPQHNDLLKAGTLDAVVSTEPFISRVTETGVAYVASYYSTFLPDGLPSTVYAVRREWAAQNAGAVRAFREGLADAAAWMGRPANDTRMREIMGKYIKLPPAVLAKMKLLPPAPVVKVAQLDLWVKIMKDQEMLRGTPDTSRLVLR